LANAMHLDIFSRGVNAWNTWRIENPVSKPNLDQLQACAVLGKSDDDFFDCHLESINLSSASLIDSNFSDVSLSAASFENTDLTNATLRRAALNRARLRNAILVGADMTFVTLDGADLTDAVFGDTLITRVDLSLARGLDCTKHRFRSIVDVGTFELTRQGLRDHPLRRSEILTFFTACGVATPYLELFESLVTSDQSDQNR